LSRALTEPSLKGNTWIRSIIEAGTRIWTGSVYQRDEQLYNAGFQGEGVNPYAQNYPTMSAIKTHWPYYTVDIHYKTTGIVYIMRSPFNAFLSEFNREYEHGHTSVVPRGVMQKYISHFLTQKRRSWVRSCKLYAGDYYFNHTSMRRHQNGVTSLLINQPVFKHRSGDLQDKTVPTLVLFYEDFVADFDTTVRVLFEYLKQRFGDIMPSVDDAVLCAIHAKKMEQAMHRPKKEDKWNAYTEPGGIPQTSGNLNATCRIAKECWYEEKWGKCDLALKQLPPGRKKISPVSVRENC
jgi:hypothetical protein